MKRLWHFSRLIVFWSHDLVSCLTFAHLKHGYRMQSDWKSLLHTLPARERDALDAKGTQRRGGDARGIFFREG